jgi:O-succinylbenzoic acid--CoA ligase
MPNGSFVWPSRPSAPFLWSDRLRLTQEALARQAAALAETIPDAERVVVRSAPGLHAIAPLLACWLRRTLAILPDPRDSPDEMARLAQATGAAVWTPGPPLALSGRDAQPLEFDTAKPAVAVRTSGSSGEPKLAVHTLGSLLTNARAANARIPFVEGDCWLLSLSPHHVGGLGILMRAMVGTGCVHVGESPGSIAADLREHRWITHVSVVATQLRRLLDDRSLDRRIIALRALLLGGGPTPASWRREAVERGWPLSVTYGLTECASQVTTSIASSTDDATDAGLPLDGIGVRCDEQGEVHVSGPTLFTGYLGRPPIGAEFATGDLGRMDARGRLHVLGRRDAMFISGGENIHPEEIENVLRSIPGIESACVVAVDDREWVKRPVAFVSGPLETSAIEASLAALPRFRWPDRILRMPEEEAARAKPRRAKLLQHLDAPIVWAKR